MIDKPQLTTRMHLFIVWFVRIAFALALGGSLSVAIGYLIGKPYLVNFGDGLGMAKPTVIVTTLLALGGFGLLTLITHDCARKTD